MPSELVKPLNSKAEFDAFLKEHKKVMVDFWATWCGPCKMISPELEKMAASPEFKDVAFCKVDVDEVEEVAQEMGIRAMPTFYTFLDGEKFGETIGANKVKVHELAAALVKA